MHYFIAPVQHYPLMMSAYRKKDMLGISNPGSAINTLGETRYAKLIFLAASQICSYEAERPITYGNKVQRLIKKRPDLAPRLVILDLPCREEIEEVMEEQSGLSPIPALENVLTEEFETSSKKRKKNKAPADPKANDIISRLRIDIPKGDYTAANAALAEELKIPNLVWDLRAPHELFVKWDIKAHWAEVKSKLIQMRVGDIWHQFEQVGEDMPTFYTPTLYRNIV